MTKPQRRAIVRSVTRCLQKHIYNTPESRLVLAIFEQAAFDLYDCSEGATYEDILSAKRYIAGDLAQIESIGVDPDFARRLVREAGERITEQQIKELRQHAKDRNQSELML